VPERAQEASRSIHAPTPDAIVDIAQSREAALDAYNTMRERSSG
jgi:hypothetical protein